MFFYLCLNKRFSKQLWGWWFETPSRSSWRHCNETNSINDPCLGVPWIFSTTWENIVIGVGLVRRKIQCVFNILALIFSKSSCYRNHKDRPFRWRHNDHAGVSNHQPHGCLLNRLFRRKSKKTSKLRVTGLCAGNSPGTGEFPAQMASYAKNVSIWWRHHALRRSTRWLLWVWYSLAFFSCLCYVVCNTVLYGAALYRELIVLKTNKLLFLLLSMEYGNIPEHMCVWMHIM